MPSEERPDAAGDPRVPVTLALLILLGAFLLWRELRQPEPLFVADEPAREVAERGGRQVAHGNGTGRSSWVEAVRSPRVQLIQNAQLSWGGKQADFARVCVLY